MLQTLDDESICCCVTSPPYYGLRDYGFDGQIGLESTPDEYVNRLVEVFREVRRVLRKDGTLWLNLGDSYSGSGKGPSGNFTDHGERNVKNFPSKFIPTGLKPKDLMGIPWRAAFALQADGWWLRQDIIWHKPNPMPESVKDRCTKSHEYVFLLSKNKKYFYNNDAVKEDGKISGEYHNRRDVWTITKLPYKGAHFATMPPGLAEVCIKAGCPDGGTVLDPFAGSGTTGAVAKQLGRNFILIEANPEYINLINNRIRLI